MSPPMARAPPADFDMGALGGCAGFDKPEFIRIQGFIDVFCGFWQKFTVSGMGDVVVFVFKTKIRYAETAKLF